MNKIVRFDSVEKFVAYRRAKANHRLGGGSEGDCYLGRDGLAYKDFTDGFRSENYIPEDVITSDEVSSKSFAFPHTLFVVGDELVGHTADVVKKDITSYDTLFFNGIDHINFDKLYRAYEVLYDDAVALAEDGIGIYDLSYNLMFDGERLVGVDTCGYYRTSPMDCLHNTECVDTAVKNLFTHYAEYVKGEKLDTDMDVKSFLEMVESRYSNYGGKKGPQYIKH